MSSLGGTGDDMETHTVPVREQEDNKGIVDRAYYRGVPAILKLLEVVFSIVAYIPMGVSYVVCSLGTDGYFRFVTVGAFTATLILWVLLLFKIPKRILTCSCVNWPFVELAFYGLVVIFYFFADLFMSIHSCTLNHKASVAFGWFAFGPYCVDLIMSARRFLKSRS